MKCSKCKSEHNVKNGIIRGKQRYKCKDCGNNFTFDYSYFAEKEKKKKIWVVNVFGRSWLSFDSEITEYQPRCNNELDKKYGSALKQIRNPKPVDIMELDELHTDVGQKNYKWIWTSVDRGGRECAAFVLGGRGTETGKKA